MTANILKTNSNKTITNPPLARFLFDDTRFSVVWLVVRVLLGLSWIQSSLGKLSNPAWMQTGEALKGYWLNAVKIPETGKPPISFDWYRGFLQSMIDSGAYTWFSKVIAFGEFFVGVGLIIGAFVGIAAFFGAFMNWNFMMAGSASTNPLLFVAAIALVLAWKTAGHYGVDRFLLPLLGTPWNREKKESAPYGTPVASEAAAD